MFVLDVIKIFKKHGVKCAVVGGYAVALHGAVRGTVDLDLVVSLEGEAFEMAERAAVELGLVPRLPVTAQEVFHFREEYIQNRNLVAWSFYDPKNPAHCLDIIITHDLRKLKTIEKRIHGQTVTVVSIPSLIEMKKQSAREQDQQDIIALKKILAREDRKS